MKHFISLVDLRDMCAAAGFIALNTGLAFMWWPLCLVVGGSILLGIWLYGGVKRGHPR